MKRKIIAAVFTGMLTVALFPAIAHAEIENPEDYMGIWYANYVIYSDESSERHNVAEYLNQYLEMRLMEDGSAYMEMSYNSEGLMEAGGRENTCFPGGRRHLS